MQRLLKLTLPGESVPFICLSYLSSSSTFSLVSLSIPTETSSSNWETSRWSNLAWAANVNLNKWVWYPLILHGKGLILRDTGVELRFCTFGWGTWASNLLMIAAIIWVRFLSSFVIFEFCCWNWRLLFFLVFHSHVRPGKNRIRKAWGALLGEILNFLLLA